MFREKHSPVLTCSDEGWEDFAPIGSSAAMNKSRKKGNLSLLLVPTRIKFLGLIGIIMGGVIFVNAVFLQQNKHPAPMFRNFSQITDAQLKEVVKPVVPLKREYSSNDKARQASNQYNSNVKNVEDVKNIPTETASYQDKADISGLLQKASMDLQKGNLDVNSAILVINVQRALNKIGYGPIAEDGRMGVGTQQALMRFEKDKKLTTKGEPPKGELRGNVIKTLAIASGYQIKP